MKPKKALLHLIACITLALCAGCAEPVDSGAPSATDNSGPPPSVPTAPGTPSSHSNGNSDPAPSHEPPVSDPTPPPAHDTPGGTGSFSYSFSENGCSTGKHHFTTQIDECYGLADSELNQNCAESARHKLFHKLGCDRP